MVHLQAHTFDLMISKAGQYAVNSHEILSLFPVVRTFTVCSPNSEGAYDVTVYRALVRANPQY